MLDCVSAMADVAQLVRASVCGTECRRFESGHPPQDSKMPVWAFFNSLGGSDENRRFDTIVDENKPREVRVLRVEGP